MMGKMARGKNMALFSPSKGSLNRLGKVIGIIILTIFLSTALANVACWDKNDMRNGRQEKPVPHPVHKIFLQEVYPYDANKHILWTGIFKVDTERRIETFVVESIEANDQSGQNCSFAGVSIEKAKGGVSIALGTRVEPGKTEKVIIKTRIVLNGDAIDVTCGFRKRTIAERKAMNPDQEWTYLDNPKEVKVTEIR
jgi:hypothetical protein